MLGNPLSKQVLDLFRQQLAPQRQITAAGRELTALLALEDGWRPFLRRVGRSTFTSEFAPFHEQFWHWYWRLTRLRKTGQPITDETLTFLLGLGRGCGKSSSVEWACITEGAMGLDGYVLYVSLTQSSAESHVADIRKRLESEEIGALFPDLASPKMGKHSNRAGWRQNFLITKGGWAIRPLGLDVAVRGLKEDDLRPTMIVFDDIDSYDISPQTVAKNLDVISRNILPAGTKRTIHLIAQNLIAEHCAVNQIATGKTDVLSEHIPCIYPAFEDDIEIIKRVNRQSGESAYEIVSCRPIWEEFDLDAARINLNKLGLEAFMAEYQHDFALDKTDRVYPEYDPRTHVITWSQFYEKFGTRGYVPAHWQVGVGLDVGYTKEHLSAWTWVGVSSDDSGLPGLYFRYRGRTFTRESINDQARMILEEIRGTRADGEQFDEREQYVDMRMSHEALNDRLILNREYELLFGIAHYKIEDGIPQWRTLLRVDPYQPHPFHPDSLDEKTGRYRIGMPTFFDVVDDDQLEVPIDDRGLAIHRAQTLTQRRRKTQIMATGLTDDVPMKIDDDANDSTRMIFAAGNLTAQPLTARQRALKSLRETVGADRMVIRKGQADYQGILLARQMELIEAQRREDEETARIASIVRGVLNAPELPNRYRR